MMFTKIDYNQDTPEEAIEDAPTNDVYICYDWSQKERVQAIAATLFKQGK